MKDLAIKALLAFLVLAGLASAGGAVRGQEGSHTREKVRAERIAELIGLLAHEDFPERERATEQLRGIGMPAVPKLRRALNSDDPEVRLRAERILNNCELGLTDDAPEDLMHTLRDFQSIPAARRNAAMKRVVEHMGPNALPFLLARAEDEDRGHSDYAVELITGMDAEVVRPFVNEAIAAPKNAWTARLKAWAGDAPEPLTLPFLEGEINLDGDDRDWKDTRPLARPLAEGKPGRLKMGWSETGLYIFYEIADGAINVSPDSPWRGDSLELFLDPGLDRDLKRNTSDLQLGFMPAGQPGAGQVTIVLGSHAVQQLDKAAICCTWKKTDKGYSLEGFVSAEALGEMKMKPGQKMGMNYAVNNNGRPVEQFACDKNENAGWESAILWAPMQLGEPQQAEGAQGADRADTGAERP